VLIVLNRGRNTKILEHLQGWDAFVPVAVAVASDTTNAETTNADTTNADTTNTAQAPQTQPQPPPLTQTTSWVELQRDVAEAGAATT
jgi:hypothetical protein